MSRETLTMRNPATFILDEKGVIVDQDLRGIQLERKVEELLRSL